VLIVFGGETQGFICSTKLFHSRARSHYVSPRRGT